jgi:hypothetical protein
MKPHRASMTHEWKSHLVQMAFEKQITKQLKLKEFLTISAVKHDDCMQLWSSGLQDCIQII